jgi:hypothetical protein
MCGHGRPNRPIASELGRCPPSMPFPLTSPRQFGRRLIPPRLRVPPHPTARRLRRAGPRQSPWPRGTAGRSS